MMESSNLNLDLHHQDDFHGSSSSSSLLLPSLQDLIQNSGEFCDGILSSTRDHFMMQELGFQWGPTSNLQDYNLMPSHVKHEFNQINGFVQPSFEPMNLAVNNNIGRSLSMVLPSTANILSSPSLHPLYSSSSFGMDLQALDLLASARFGRPMSQPSLLNDMALLREDLAYGTLGQLQEQTHAAQISSTSRCKASHSASGSATELAKRSNSTVDCGTSQPTAKKPRFESRSSFTPFKVRKEKLGDRIAALQQLVAPFGKTDTASVLMEAIGYIKFLQDQVETLSVPYMRSSNNKKTRASQEVASEERDEAKPDLRSRGLCLVPLSCMSYVTNENGGVWSPNSNYRGGS